MLASWYHVLLKKRVFFGGCGLFFCILAARPLLHPNLYAVAASLILCGLLLRGWASGIIHKGKTLAVTGPYSLLRHPLYSGSFLISLGCSLATGRWWLLLGLNFGFVLLYRGVMACEESLILERFGQQAQQFLATRRRWLPGFGNGTLAAPWSWRRVLIHHGEWQAWLGILLYGALLAWRLQFPVLL